MAIVFSNTQGDREITVNDNQLDQTNYSVTLIGKNVTNYGQIIAQNSIRQLENFANTTAPNPGVKLVGQLWFDKTGNHLRVYKNDTEQFEELAYRPKSGTATPTTSRGSSVEAGELFFDSTTGTGDLKIYHSNAWQEVLSDLTIRSKVSHVDAGGDGSFAYNSTTGVFTYTGPSASEVRAHFSGGTGVTYTSGSGVIAIGQAVETTSDVQFNNAVIDGNLTVNGTQTILNTETLTIDDNIIVLNNNEAGTPSANAGIEVERGTSTNVRIRWNEGTDHWEITNDGTNYTKIAQDTDELTEGSTNLYYTNARARAAISESSTQLAYNSTTGVLTYTQGNTDTVSEGSSNLYYTNARADARVNLQTGTNLDLSQKTTSDLAEGTNLYYTDARADARIQNNIIDQDSFSSNSSTRAPSQQSVKAYVDAQIDTKDALSELSGDTDDVSEGTTNLYYTNARADARIAAASTSDLSEGTNLYYTNARADARIAAADTNDLSEGSTNLYHTNARVITAISSSDITTQNIVATGPSGTYNIGSSSVKFGTMYANTFNGTATAAQYADLAEMYLADAGYEEGTVLVFGGEQEVTISNKKASPSIAGVVSSNPAYLMNSELEGDHVTAVALKGRVPVKVIGAVTKGDVLVHSSTPGHAEAAINNMTVNGPSCIGIAITEKADSGAGTVEALVK